jgi:hypothetical protein
VSRQRSELGTSRVQDRSVAYWHNLLDIICEANICVPFLHEAATLSFQLLGDGVVEATPVRLYTRNVSSICKVCLIWTSRNITTSDECQNLLWRSSFKWPLSFQSFYQNSAWISLPYSECRIPPISSSSFDHSESVRRGAQIILLLIMHFNISSLWRKSDIQKSEGKVVPALN